MTSRDRSPAGFLTKPSTAPYRNPLNRNGIIVVQVNGKQNLRLPYAILATLGIPTFVVFDGNAHNAERRPDDTDQQLATRIPRESRKNRQLLTLLGEEPEEWPETRVRSGYAVFHDTLDDHLGKAWQEWGVARKQLIEDGIGTGEKEEQSYRQAARQATAPPSHELAEIIARARLLAKEN